MDTTWFQDFLAVLEEGGFTRAAERRAVSQPAFSRRIKALEDWVGASLFDRTTHSVTLTAAGERLLPAAEELLRRLQIARADAANAAQLQHDALKFAATHVLSFAFFPIWLRSVEALAPMTGTIQLTSDIMVACENLMIEGRAHFLLCHDHPAVATRLSPESFRSIEIGQDTLVPVAAPHLLETCKPGFPPYLAYTTESQPGRILAAAWASAGQHPPQEPAFSSPLVSVITAMARDGRGMSWSPLSLVAEDIAAGRLARVGNVAAEVPIGIRLFRPQARQSPAAEAFWKQAVRASSERARLGEPPVCRKSAVDEISHC
jgi:LysR family transcriptional regulator, hypochlorite-specific transcription factor HypT